MQKIKNLFGTVLTVDAFDENISFLNLILKDLKKMHLNWNIFDSTSLLSILNDKDILFVDEQTKEIIQKSVEYYNSTNHHFNPCYFNLKQKYNTYSDVSNTLVNESSSIINDSYNRGNFSTNENCNPNLIDFQNKSIRLNEQRLDLGGIAKGYALDFIDKSAEKFLQDDVYVNFGGSILVRGNHPDNEKGFNIGIVHPENKSQNILELYELTNTTLTTSATYEQHAKIDNVLYSHIFTAEGLVSLKEQILSITIIDTDAIKSDAFCTAIIAMGLKKALLFLKKHETLEFFLITQEKEVIYRYESDVKFRILDTGYSIREI